MLRFDPPELQQLLARALDRLEDVIYYQWYRFNDPKFDANACHDELTITPRTEVDECYLSSDQDPTGFHVCVQDLLEWADALNKHKLKNRTFLRLSNETFIHVEPLGQKEYELLEDVAEELTVESKVLIDGREFRCSLVSGFTTFAVFIEDEGGVDHHHASFYPNTGYLWLEHPEPAEDKTILDVANAFLFELATSAEVTFSMAPYPEVEYPDEDEERDQHDVTLRPLVLGHGLPDLYELFVAGCSANPAEYALIHFVKVIEYVSATVVRSSRHDALRKRLSGKAALAPDAEFLDDLADLIEEQRLFNKDAEALKLTLQTCCDPVTLASTAPRFLKVLRGVREESDPKLKRTALDELSACLSATRNQLSHAKANYELTGAECPSDELGELTYCAQHAAQQVIRWYARLPDSSRVA